MDENGASRGRVRDRCRGRGSSSASASESTDSSLGTGRGGHGGKKTAIPSKASDWKRKNLSEIGVYYHDVAWSLHEFMCHIKKDEKYRSVVLPNICKKVISFTNEIWTFSLDLRLAKRDSIEFAISETNDSTAKLKSNENNLREQLSEGSEKVIFAAWKLNLLCFWANLKRLLARWGKPGQREASFTHLFMLFSRICLLDPETGEAYAGSRTVKGVQVHSIPDVRFNTLTSTGQLTLVIVTEVKQYDAFRGDFNKETFCADNIGNRILGQHGIELIVEAHDSYFGPCVAGMICIGTQIIFTYLDITPTHVASIEENRPSGLKSTILYTRPFDFMDVADRKEILETLFWFGYIQSGSYEDFTY